MSMYRVKIICNGEETSNELNEFQSIWRAFGDTVRGFEPYDEEFHIRRIKFEGGIGGTGTYTFKDGTQIIVEQADVQTRTH